MTSRGKFGTCLSIYIREFYDCSTRAMDTRAREKRKSEPKKSWSCSMDLQLQWHCCNGIFLHLALHKMIESVPPPHLQSTSMNQQHQPGGGMERVLFNVHHRICRFWMRRTSSQTRLLIEHLLLLSAILCFGLLVLLQKSFAFRQGTTNCASSCLLDYKNTSSDLIRLTITSPNHQRWPSTQNNSHHDRVMDEYTCHTSERSPTFEYSYSKTKAYLLLEPNDPLLKQLQVQNIQIDPYNLKCFGDGALQFLVWNLGFGWDTILINWLLMKLVKLLR